jgi:glycosyltransferase involved in cell wall biosynthesis
MLVIACVAIALLLTALPVGLFLKNTKLFTTSPADTESLQKAESIRLSVCIPARNEAKSIGNSLKHLVESTHSDFEILVMDDNSEDNTAAIVEECMARSNRVRLLKSAPLPLGWNGKQFACWQLAKEAKNEWIMFVDADVRVSPDALTRCIAEQQSKGTPLVSGFPRQVTGTWSEKLLIPMMHYVLLCFLPIDRMRASAMPGFAAGCGQLFLANRETYLAVGGHSAIAGSRHDGIQLPRAFRRQGFATDIFDASDIVSCRMYENIGQVQRGLLKNAYEGIANPKLILPFTVLLLGGTLLPLLLTTVAIANAWPLWSIATLAVLSLASWIPRLVAASKFRQSWFGALCHPIALVWFVVLQWIALIQGLLGIKVTWRGRV